MLMYADSQPCDYQDHGHKAQSTLSELSTETPSHVPKFLDIQMARQAASSTLFEFSNDNIVERLWRQSRPISGLAFKSSLTAGVHSHVTLPATSTWQRDFYITAVEALSNPLMQILQSDSQAEAQ